MLIFITDSQSTRLDPSLIFPALSYIRMLCIPLRQLPQDAMIIIQGLSSWNRIREFLGADEIRVMIEKVPEDEPDVAVGLEDAKFVWDTKAELRGGGSGSDEPAPNVVVPVFDGLDLRIRKGALVAIVGNVGMYCTCVIVLFFFLQYSFLNPKKVLESPPLYLH